MRIILAPAIAFTLIGASGEVAKTPDQQGMAIAAQSVSLERSKAIDESVVVLPHARSADKELCNDRITQAREENGQPPLLDREPASPERPYAIYAVDREQDGCSVVVMMGDREDIRPLPLPPEKGGALLPAEPSK
ncbi:hypothetical protein [Erythrobacter sp.]|jgi:hypothetical protein|uniref:hypothetical protein n=1 Tax=Erythrobacter sp. TaxID=1042 RepID=UPI002EC0D2BC|nr:hypothetical protein [Erythrobacter sp.]